MKRKLIRSCIPGFVMMLGLLGNTLRRQLYLTGVDNRGLLVPGSALEIALWTLTALALGIIAVTAWRLDGSDAYEDNFSASFVGAAGHIFSAAGIGMTVLLNPPVMPGLVGSAWKSLGILSGICLIAAAFCRVLGKKPLFLLHLIPSVFLAVHILNQFQSWSGNPQLMDYVFALFGTVSLLMFGYYTAAFSEGIGNRRMHLVCGLAAVYLCMVNIPMSGYPWLYAGGALWAVSDLCTLFPKPKQEPPAEEKEPEDETA